MKRVFGIIILLAVAGGAFYTFFSKKKEDLEITYSTSDARNLKGEFTIALDSWIGYFPFISPVFGKMMRDEGYRVKVIDDRADYPERMKMLRRGNLDFAVCTVDSYLLNGEEVKYPGAIVAVIDESKGGDAILAWKDRVANIEQLKRKKDFKIAFTPASPSEHLLKAISVHFDIPRLGRKEDTWRIEVDGAEEAHKKLMNREVDLAVVWEPHVTEALTNKGITKIIGSEDVEKLIVDILLVNRKFAIEKPDLVKIFLKNYFETLNVYRTSTDKLNSDIVSRVKLSGKQVDYMLKGVRWIQYPENVNWFGLATTGTLKQPEIVESINSTIDILIGNNDFKANPLTDKDPYTIINSSFIRELYKTGELKSPITSESSANSLRKRFSKLSEAEWGMLKVVGSLRLRPISFRSGTSELDPNGHEQVKLLVNSIRHYPNFRILVKGHTGLRGDRSANIRLSRKRAETVKNELRSAYNIDPNRIRIIGMGSREPLPRDRDESDRGYENRLKRVEISFLSNN